MKKILSVILLIAVISISSVSAIAAENAHISFETYTSENSKNVYVDVLLSGNGKPSMMQFCVAYESDALELVSAKAGTVFAGNLAPLINETEGRIYFVWDSLTPLSGNGVLLELEFALKDSSKNASVWIDTGEEFFIADENFEDIGVAGEKTEIGEGPSEGESQNGKNESGSSSAPESSADSDVSQNAESKESSSESAPSDNSENGGAQSAPEAESGYSSGIEIDRTSLSIGLGEEAVINIDETDKEVFWYSSNESIVRVENGKIIPVAPGTATITVVTEDGLGEAACVVTVRGEESTDNSSEENGSSVIEVESPRKEKDSSVPAWAWILIALLGTGVAAAAVLIFKKTGIMNKNK